MKQIIEQRLFNIREKMTEMETIHLYYLDKKWIEYRTCATLLESLLTEAEKTGV